MDSLGKPLVVLAAVAFVVGVVVGLMGGDVMNVPAESFSRACDNLALIAIAVMMMAKNT